MKKTLCLTAAMLLTFGLLAGCGGGGDKPFDGKWIAQNGAFIEFDGSTWRDSDGDVGAFTYEGAYPEFTMIFDGTGPTVSMTALFIDKNTLRLCELFTGGVVGECSDLTRDEGMVPGI